MYSVKQKLRELAPRRSDNSKPVVIKTPVIKDSVIKTPVKVKENLFSPSIHTQEKPISSRGKRERDVKLISPSVLKHALTDYYAKAAS